MTIAGKARKHLLLSNGIIPGCHAKRIQVFLIMNIPKIISFLVSIAFYFATPLSALPVESVSPKQYVCYRTASPMIIDGKASENCWKKAEWTTDFVDIIGVKGATPRFKTRAKMVWDDDFLYVFAELCEPHIWANVKNRDETMFVDNDFEVFIDPDGDTHHYYEYEMNALNTQWDLLLTRPYRDGGIPVTSWNFDGMSSAVQIDGTLNDPSDVDLKWSVEIAFPLRSLIDSITKFPVKAGDQWRINFSRVEWQTFIENGRYVKFKNTKTGKPLPEDNWVWSPQGVVNMHCPETWGFLQFSDLVAGEGTTTFVVNPEEAVKDELRKLYFAQQKYRSTHNQYANKIGDLYESEVSRPQFKFNPSLKGSPTAYELSAKRSISGKVWHLNETGRVWAE